MIISNKVFHSYWYHEKPENKILIKDSIKKFFNVFLNKNKEPVR